jgi:Zn-dependent peptidase ImmA (M78 family)/transcriptional regulator with XRE-family HTH domain
MELAERLREAREAAGLSIRDAAARLGFTNYQTLSSIEKGEREVKASELALFGKTYFCSLNKLLIGDETQPSAVHFLWRQAPTERKTEVEAFIKHRFEEYHLLEKLLGLTQDEASVIISVSPADVRTKFKVDALATKVSNLLNLGSRPAMSLQKVMEQMLRTKLLFVELSDFGSAASTVHPEFGAAIVINSEEAPWRINFTLAHELFHIITWSTFNPSELEQDEALFREIERKADRFASSLLLPETAVREELIARSTGQKLSFSDIVDVAREFGVSTQALLYRMANMQLIEWLKADELAKNDELMMIDRRVRREAGCEVPSSQRFIQLAVKCLRKGLISRGKFSELLAIDRADIDEVLEFWGLSEVEGESIEIMAS